MKSNSAVTMLEYAILTVVLLLAVLAVVPMMRTKISQRDSTMGDVAQQTYPSPLIP